MKFRDFIKQLNAHLAWYSRETRSFPFVKRQYREQQIDDIREFWEAGYTPAQAAALMMGDHASPALDRE